MKSTGLHFYSRCTTRRFPMFIKRFVTLVSIASSVFAGSRANAQDTSPPAGEAKLLEVGKGWAANSVNTAVFRTDPITTWKDKQFVAYYDADSRVVIATRTLGNTTWTPTVTSLTGNTKDAHNVISIIADGDGYLHMAWDHHGHPLRYVKSVAPGSIEFTKKIPMTGQFENKVTYPQFFKLADGSLIFLYRDGGSGRGNLALNHYDTKAQKWTQVHSNFISGENQRNAYPQSTVDSKGSIHISWVWRETGNVATNHDVCYARSDDGGKTWCKSDGTPYALPITLATAEIAAPVPQKHELINQTSMCTDSDGHPIIATYFRPEGTTVPQFFVIAHDGKTWRTIQVSNRTTPFSLSGGGSKAIPISRPQVLAKSADGKTSVSVIYRDLERGSKVSASHSADLSSGEWTTRDLTDFGVRFWEPSYDHIRWERDGILNLFVQSTGQGDGEQLEAIEPQPVFVLEWMPH
jgi:predicted lipoprotein with Yx(FWY)xxD motif